MKKSMILTVMFVLLVTSVVLADNTMVLKFDHYTGPSEYRAGEFLKAAKAFQEAHPDYTAVVTFFHPEGFGMSPQRADSLVRTFALTLQGNGVKVASYRSVTGASGQSEFQLVWEAPVMTEIAVNNRINTKIKAIKRPANGVSLFAYAIGPASGQADGGVAIGYTGSEVFSQRVGLVLGLGGRGGNSVKPGVDINNTEAYEEAQAVDSNHLFGLVGVTFNALRVDKDKKAWYFDLTPSVLALYNSREMDWNGQFGMVGGTLGAGLNLGWGWMSPGRNFTFKMFVEPGMGLGYWYQSSLRPCDVGYPKAKWDLTLSGRVGVEFLF